MEKFEVILSVTGPLDTPLTVSSALISSAITVMFLLHSSRTASTWVHNEWDWFCKREPHFRASKKGSKCSHACSVSTNR